MCNWVCEKYTDIYAAQFYGCKDIKLYVEDGRHGAYWRDIPYVIREIEVFEFGFMIVRLLSEVYVIIS